MNGICSPQKDHRVYQHSESWAVFIVSERLEVWMKDDTLRLIGGMPPESGSPQTARERSALWILLVLIRTRITGTMEEKKLRCREFG